MKKNIKKIIDNTAFAYMLGDGLFSKFHVLFVTFLFPVEHLFKVGRDRALTFHLIFENKSFVFMVRDSSDIAVLKEVFLLGEYKLDLKQEPGVIVDLGSNVGASVVYFALRYPDARIIAVEADPITADYLRSNTKSFKNISVLNYAIAGTDGVLDFYIYPQSRMSSSLTRRTPDQKIIQVPALTFKSLLIKEQVISVDLLKFDIEGAEVSAFSDKGSLSQVKVLVGEIHLDLVGVTEESVWKCFNDFSYTKQTLSKKRFIIQGSRIN